VRIIPTRRLLPFAHCLLIFALLSLPFAFAPSPLALALRFPAATQASPSANPSRSDRALAAVVQLLAVGPGERGKNRECSATGFLVNEEGYLVTNAHVVEDAQRCLGRSPGAKILAKLATPGAKTAPAASCDVVGLDEVHDLAVLKTERPLRADPSAAPAYAWLDPGAVAVGTPLVVSGHPAFAWQPVTQSGKLVWRGTRRLLNGSTEASEVLVVNIPLRRGNSGSPVYREAGGVVGVIAESDESRLSHSVAVPIRYAIELLTRLGVRWHAGGRGDQ
jgi:S1-C subfamily serine protease